MGLIELQHIQKMSSDFGIALFAVLPFFSDLGLIIAGVGLWRLAFGGN